MIGDGAGRTAHTQVLSADRTGLVVRVEQLVTAPEDPRPVTVVQALAKGDRAELAVELMTEVGVTRIQPWQSERSIVRWQGERGAKSLAKWRSTAREATKQSRRPRIPAVTEPVRTADLCAGWSAEPQPVVLVLHEDATTALAEVELPEHGEVVLVVGPEGGLTAAEMDAFTAAGARTVSISDGVLRTSTAGALAAGMVRGR